MYSTPTGNHYVFLGREPSKVALYNCMVCLVALSAYVLCTQIHSQKSGKNNVCISLTLAHYRTYIQVYYYTYFPTF